MDVVNPSESIFYNYTLWKNDEIPETVTLPCLLPTGAYFEVVTSINTTFAEVKEELWERQEKMHIQGLLHDKSEYAFNMITGCGASCKLETLSDESKRIIDVQPFLIAIQITGKDKIIDNELDKSITALIGKPTEDFSKLNNPEVNEFRHKMQTFVEAIADTRRHMTFEQRLQYQYPPRLASTYDVPPAIKERYPEKKFIFNSKFGINQNTFTYVTTFYDTPFDLLTKILAKKSMKTNLDPSDCILKVCGQDEYIFGEYPIIQFLYIQDMLSRSAVPCFVTQAREHINIDPEPVYLTTSEIASTRQSSSTSTLRKKHKIISSWEITSSFKITIHAINQLNCDASKPVEVGIMVGLFHGGKSLCEPQKTKEIVLQMGGDDISGARGVWEEDLVFDIQVVNIPRMARLCLVVYEMAKNTRTGRRKVRDNKYWYINPLAWVNTTVFDYKNQLKIGAMTLYTWTYAEDTQSDDLLHPLGTVESNPRTDERASIMLSLHNYNIIDNSIVYPADELVLEHAKNLEKIQTNRDSAQDTRDVFTIIGPFLNNDRIHDIHDQERTAIWAKRQDCMRDLPDGLPILLHCVEWKNRDEVAKIRNVLTQWKPISDERALELLDYAYADPTVRSFAVSCLNRLNDDQLLLYLLQLVQAVKHESYVQCDLVQFLLRRALHNQRIGHYLFWHLRSEMHFPSMQIRFGIILELYLRGCQVHIPALLQQVECLEELRKASEQAKKFNKEKGRHLLLEFLNKSEKKFSDVISPLNPSYRCKSLRINRCKVMDSKMRPLWMVFENGDKNGDDICVIFKNGDDLRQDMLTIQMLRIMDQIWKRHGYDFRMNPYGCVSTDRHLGMIEVVLNAETIANIQKEKGMFSATSAFKKGSLLAWLKDHNKDADLDKAIHEFTLSCAGYCVATYVLGVADRHSDNIMVKKTGQLFHIDFGHILGHFKEKFGFRRERVPFVLTHDFVYIINNGKIDRETDEFKNFRKLCEEAFLLLRKHGCLILSLFAMMISTGLPELTSEKDLNYLRDTLVLDLSEESALEHFRSKFAEALLNSWKTSLNWASHNFSKNNKQ